MLPTGLTGQAVSLVECQQLSECLTTHVTWPSQSSAACGMQTDNSEVSLGDEETKVRYMHGSLILSALPSPAYRHSWTHWKCNPTKSHNRIPCPLFHHFKSPDSVHWNHAKCKWTPHATLHMVHNVTNQLQLQNFICPPSYFDQLASKMLQMPPS